MAGVRQAALTARAFSTCRRSLPNGSRNTAHGQSSYASAIDNCLWDILGKAVGLPVYRILGAYRDKVLAYASSQHHATVEDFVNEVRQVKGAGVHGLQDPSAIARRRPRLQAGHRGRQGGPQGRGRRLHAAERSGRRLHARGGHQGRPRAAGPGLRCLRRPHPDQRH